MNEPLFEKQLIKTCFAEDVDQLSDDLEELKHQESSVTPIEAGIAKKDFDFIPANPLLPKTMNLDLKQPAECPLKDIVFLQLERFKRFKNQKLTQLGEGYDHVGKLNIVRTVDKKQEEPQVKMDDATQFITNIVFARDPKIFDNKTNQVSQRQAFMHENYLDIKAMIR